MLVRMRKDVDGEAIEAVKDISTREGFDTQISKKNGETIIAIFGFSVQSIRSQIETLPGIEKIEDDRFFLSNFTQFEELT